MKFVQNNDKKNPSRVQTYSAVDSIGFYSILEYFPNLNDDKIHRGHVNGYNALLPSFKSSTEKSDDKHTIEQCLMYWELFLKLFGVCCHPIDSHESSNFHSNIGSRVLEIINDIIHKRIVYEQDINSYKGKLDLLSNRDGCFPSLIDLLEYVQNKPRKHIYFLRRHFKKQKNVLRSLVLNIPPLFSLALYLDTPNHPILYIRSVTWQFVLFNAKKIKKAARDEKRGVTCMPFLDYRYYYSYYTTGNTNNSHVLHRIGADDEKNKCIENVELSRGKIIREWQSQEYYEKLIDHDLPRTFPTHCLFNGAFSIGQSVMKNILHKFVFFDPDLGYCQGMSYIIAMLLTQMNPADAFSCFCGLMYNPLFQMRQLFLTGFPLLHLLNFQFLSLLPLYLSPILLSHLYSVGILPDLLTFVLTRWWMTLMVHCLPIQLTIKIWDLFLFKGWTALFSTALVLLQMDCQFLLDCNSIEIVSKRLQYGLSEGKDLNSVFNDVFKHKISERRLESFKKQYYRQMKGST